MRIFPDIGIISSIRLNRAHELVTESTHNVVLSSGVREAADLLNKVDGMQQVAQDVRDGANQLVSGTRSLTDIIIDHGNNPEVREQVLRPTARNGSLFATQAQLLFMHPISDWSTNQWEKLADMVRYRPTGAVRLSHELTDGIRQAARTGSPGWAALEGATQIKLATASRPTTPRAWDDLAERVFATPTDEWSTGHWEQFWQLASDRPSPLRLSMSPKLESEIQRIIAGQPAPMQDALEVARKMQVLLHNTIDPPASQEAFAARLEALKARDADWDQAAWQEAYALLASPYGQERFAPHNRELAAVRRRGAPDGTFNNPLLMKSASAKARILFEPTNQPTSPAAWAEQMRELGMLDSRQWTTGDWARYRTLIDSEHSPLAVQMGWTDMTLMLSASPDRVLNTEVSLRAPMYKEVLSPVVEADAQRARAAQLVQTAPADWSFDQWSDAYRVARGVTKRLSMPDETQRATYVIAGARPDASDIQAIMKPLLAAAQEAGALPGPASRSAWLDELQRLLQRGTPTEWTADDWVRVAVLEASPHRPLNIPMNHGDVAISAIGMADPDDLRLLMFADAMSETVGLDGPASLAFPETIAWAADRLQLIANGATGDGETLPFIADQLEVIREWITTEPARDRFTDSGMQDMAGLLQGQTMVRLDDNIDRLRNRRSDGYRNFPDWAELGEAATDLQLLAELMAQ